MQYKKSFLGVGWILLAPLIGFASWVFMNAAGVLKPGDMAFPYPAFVLISTTLWGFFTSSVIAASRTLKAGQSFIGQVNYPHHTMLFKELMQVYANFLISFVFVTVLLLCFNVSLDVLYFATPILVLPMMALAAALGLSLAIINVVSMDIDKIVGYLLNFFMFLTPVVYTADNKTGIVKVILTCNPLTYLHGCARDLIVFGQTGDGDVFICLTLVAVLFMLLTMKWFYVAEEKVIEKMI
jgi:lipopolysaccharide transport system permease protein